ncbi:MAG TPA: histidine kinase [Solirubrobacteraceae bacterium]|jgi:two-component system sensor histidine kinase KdpD|nr:histidine kinase [Solirubrobacteraceae bacterium]
MPGERGHLKVFIGMAAGVGKTFRMLQEGQAEAEAGRDVVVGYLEPHGRMETVAQAEGLEVVPRRRVRYRDTEIEEMDLPAVLARAPELALIDELAHTNAPGVEHEKRYEDVRDVLEAGIDVYSTVNVQHLESLNDQVTQLTGVRVRETIPDAVLSAADETVLVDITPEALIGRLRAGKVYAPERVQAALSNFFKIENLAALRETALRQVAEGVELERRGRETSASRWREDSLVARAAPQVISERLLALVTPTPRSQRVVRRAWRSAQRLGAELDLLVVRSPGATPTREEREQLEALRRLASVLGAHLLIEEADDVADTTIRVARGRGTTYMLMGTPRPRNAWRRLTQPALPFQLMKGLPGVDLRFVADRTLLPSGESVEEEGAAL